MVSTMFPGHGVWVGVDFASSTMRHRGTAIVALDKFFLNTVSLVTSVAATHTGHNTRYYANGVHISGLTEPLADSVCRRLYIEAHVERVCIQGIRWLDALPALDALHGLVQLRIVDLDITTLPSLSPLINLLELHLVDLCQMVELPDTICEAPKLCTLQLKMLLRLRAVSDAFVRRLAAKAVPLRALDMTLCACEVPAGIGLLTGLHSLHLEDRAARLDNLHGPPSHLPDLSGLTCLQNLSIRWYPLVGLHEAQAALPSLIKFVYEDELRTPYARDSKRLAAFIASCVSLRELTVKRYGFRLLSVRLSGLMALQTLTLHGLYITSLDDDIASLAGLVSLTVRKCPKLRHFGSNILRGCKRLRHLTLDFFGNFRARSVCWQVVACVPDMTQLETIVVVNTGDEPAQALVDALRCWPPSCVTTASFDSSFCLYWEHYGIGEPASHRWSALDQESRSRHLVPVLRGWRQSHEQVAVALVMGLHTRLGAASVLAALDSELAAMVFANVRALQIETFEERWGDRVRFACLPTGADTDSDE